MLDCLDVPGEDSNGDECTRFCRRVGSCGDGWTTLYRQLAGSTLGLACVRLSMKLVNALL